MVRLAAAVLLLASTLFAQDPDLLRHFDYDQKAPLDLQEAGSKIALLMPDPLEVRRGSQACEVSGSFGKCGLV